MEPIARREPITELRPVSGPIVYGYLRLPACTPARRSALTAALSGYCDRHELMLAGVFTDHPCELAYELVGAQHIELGSGPDAEPVRTAAFVGLLDALAADGSYGVVTPSAAHLGGRGVAARRADLIACTGRRLIALSARSREGLRAATGLEPEAFADTQLSHYAEGALHFSRFDRAALDAGDDQVVQALTVREWAIFHGSRACPACLAQEPAWPLWWKLGIAACCPRHRLLLVDDCPGCGIRLRRGRRLQPGPLSKTVLADPRHCGNAAGGRARTRCLLPYADLPAIAVPEALARAQQAVLEAAEGTPRPIAGTAVDAVGWFAALRFLMVMIRFSLAPDPSTQPIIEAVPQITDALAADHRRQAQGGAGGGGGKRQMPGTAGLAAALLALAYPVLTAPDQGTCRQALDPLVSAAARRRQSRHHNLLRALPVPGPLAEALDAMIPQGDRAALRYTRLGTGSEAHAAGLNR